MALNDIFKSKKRRGFSCQPNQDGSETCRRTIEGKDGKTDFTGDIMTISADPSSNCEPFKKGDMQVMDDEMESFDRVAKRVSKGCKNRMAQKPGLTPG